MSIKAMNWAWEQKLEPSKKLTLMALADAANEKNICWPGNRFLAKKCNVSTRTIQRHIQSLTSTGFITSTQRTRQDGSFTSNLYTLIISSRDNLTPSPESIVTQLTTEEALDHDTPVVTLITSETKIKTSQQAHDKSHKIDFSVIEKNTSTADLKTIKKLILQIESSHDAQDITSEFSKRIECTEIKSPVGYLKSILKKYKNEPLSTEKILKRDNTNTLNSKKIEGTNGLKHISYIKNILHSRNHNSTL